MSEEALPASAEAPKSLLDRAGVALPIALTALATALAGMSTGELQQAMLWRSAAAQDQSKATSQWTLAGFKRDRALICQAASAQLHATGGGEAGFAGGGTGAAWLAGDGPPAARLPDLTDEHLAKLLDDLRSRVPEAEVLRQARRVSGDSVTAAIDAAEQSVEQTDRDWTPTLKESARLVATVSGTPKGAAAQAAAFELDRRRYQIEASLNQGVSLLYEARVKVSSAESERHQKKSKHFFYAMLAAQVGATISALALARKNQSLLWGVAGGTGFVALVIGAYVYLADV